MAIIALPIFACAAAAGRGGAPGQLGAGAGARAAAGSAAAAANAGPAPVEVARATFGRLTAVKWRLGNGLEIVLAPDPQATTISYQTWFRVGSRDENEAGGETGLAHLFEHLMFTQTKTMPAGGFDRAMEAAGASANAMTSYDFTAYVNDVPPAELAVAARLESDRMLNLDLRKNQVETERDVVVEERLSSVEDNVDGTLEELLFKQAFKTHPYRWPVIGWMKDIKAVTRDKAVAFYRRFYSPGNAVVVLAGKFDADEALALLARSYGPLPASEPPPADSAKPERAPAAEVRATLQRPVPADRVVVGFPAPALGDPDRAAYEIAAEILAGGPSSPLPRTLIVDKQWASSVRGDVAPTRDPGLYMIWVQMTKGHTGEEAERIIVDATAALAARPVAAAQLGTAAARLETELLRLLSSSHGRAEGLGEFEVAGGGFARLYDRAGEYARVTADDVRRVATKYFAGGARSVVIARPAPDGGNGNAGGGDGGNGARDD
jgi:zinc protease